MGFCPRRIDHKEFRVEQQRRFFIEPTGRPCSRPLVSEDEIGSREWMVIRAIFPGAHRAGSERIGPRLRM